MAPFLGEPSAGGGGSRGVRRALISLAERLARGDQRGEGRVGVAQVGVGGHQVGLGDPDRRLRPALGLRVERLTRLDHHPVVPAGGDDLGCRTATPATYSTVTVFSLSVNRYVGAAADAAQRGVQAGQQRTHRLVPRRDHDPEP